VKTQHIAHDALGTGTSREGAQRCYARVDGVGSASAICLGFPFKVRPAFPKARVLLATLPSCNPRAELTNKAHPPADLRTV
jgi:hypothetical protein